MGSLLPITDPPNLQMIDWKYCQYCYIVIDFNKLLYHVLLNIAIYVVMSWFAVAAAMPLPDCGSDSELLPVRLALSAIHSESVLRLEVT